MYEYGISHQWMTLQSIPSLQSYSSLFPTPPHTIAPASRSDSRSGSMPHRCRKPSSARVRYDGLYRPYLGRWPQRWCAQPSIYVPVSPCACQVTDKNSDTKMKELVALWYGLGGLMPIGGGEWVRDSILRANLILIILIPQEDRSLGISKETLPPRIQKHMCMILLMMRCPYSVIIRTFRQAALSDCPMLESLVVSCDF